ncbi:MAG: hypothetical protein EBR40_09935 [Proteobacteria bacterium]|nr:hypothetical protein [Pseudomonadota bacterium]
MAFGPSPKQKLLDLAQVLYPNSLIEVVGYRAKNRGGKKPPFIAQVNIDGRCQLTVMERDHRTAYKSAEIVLSRMTSV